MCTVIKSGKKMSALTHPPMHMNYIWNQVIASNILPFLQLGFSNMSGAMITAMFERWHEETSSFHLHIREKPDMVDDLACLLHI